MHKNILNLVRLLDPYADPHAVHARLHQHPLVLVPRDRQRRQQHLGRRSRLDLGDIVPLGRLGGEVGEGQSGRQGAADALEVGAEGLGLRAVLASDLERKGGR